MPRWHVQLARSFSTCWNKSRVNAGPADAREGVRPFLEERPPVDGIGRRDRAVVSIWAGVVDW
jgi:hypothetical protein